MPLVISFYWLEVPLEYARHGMLLKARREGNRIFIGYSDYARLTLLLNDEMLDLDKPVIVEYEGKVIFRGKVKRSPEMIDRSLRERQDPRLVYTARLPLSLH